MKETASCRPFFNKSSADYIGTDWFESMRFSMVFFYFSTDAIWNALYITALKVNPLDSDVELFAEGLQKPKHPFVAILGIWGVRYKVDVLNLGHFQFFQ